MLITYVAQNGVFGTADNQLIRNYFLTNLLAAGYQIEQLAKVYTSDYDGMVPFAGDEVHGNIIMIEGAQFSAPGGRDFSYAIEKTKGRRRVYYIQWDNQQPKVDPGWIYLTTQFLKDRKSVRTEMPKCLVDYTDIESLPNSGQDNKVLVHSRGIYWKRHIELIESGLLIPRDYFNPRYGVEDSDLFLAPGATSFYEEAKKHKFSLILSDTKNMKKGNIPSQFYLALMAGSLPLLDEGYKHVTRALLGKCGCELTVSRDRIEEKLATLTPKREQLIAGVLSELRALKTTQRTMEKLVWAFRHAR